MNILYLTYALDGLLMVAGPIALGIYVTRKYQLYWRLWWMGALALVLSTLLLVPVNNYVGNNLLPQINNNPAISSIMALILSAFMLALATAIVEGLLRFSMFRWAAKDARTWPDGLLTASGFGGSEALLLGLLVLYNFINMAIVRNRDLSTIVPLAQVEVAKAQVAAFWSAPWYSTLNDAVQGLFAVPVQILLTFLVMLAITRKQGYWLFIALGAQTLFETIRLVSVNLLNGYFVDLIIAGFGIACIFLLVSVWRSMSRHEDLAAASGRN